MIQKIPLAFINNHLFLELDGNAWLLDTGSPTSFGIQSNITLAGKAFDLATSGLGLDVETLSGFVNHQCVGLIGGDVLSCFDQIFDVENEVLAISQERLEHDGQIVSLSTFMNIPIVVSRVADRNYRMFFDTGAQISYFQDDAIFNFSRIGEMADFYPGIGQFQTDTYQVEMALGGMRLSLVCGILPELLAASLMMADARGIVGNQILLKRTAGFFPRRGVMTLGDEIC
jgi:hypothetical protein